MSQGVREMAFSPNSTQSREMTELRNHLKWLDEERRKTARKLTEMEQRIAQQGRELSEREKRIHELEWQLAQVSERVEQMPELGAGSSGQEQRLQDLEWHMSNINAQLVRLPKLDEELANFREEISQYTVDIENRLIGQQIEASQRLETDVYSRLREDVTQAVAGYDERLTGLQTDVDNRMIGLQADVNDRVDQQLVMSVQSVQEELLERLAALESTVPVTTARLTDVEALLGGLATDDDDDSPAILTRLEQELELRQAEELRLANLIGVQESKIEESVSRLNEMNQLIAEIQAKTVQSDEALAELDNLYRDLDDNWKPALMEASGKLVPLSERLNVLSNTVTKSEANIQTLVADQTEMREGLVNVSEEMRQARQDLTSQVDNWQVTIDEHKETIERFTQQWLTLSNQYKEARMAVQNFAHWQKQLEQQKREASEMLRVESNRMQSRWEGFLLEIQEQLKNVELDLAQKWQAFEIENEQKWDSARRNEQVWREELASVDDLIVKLQQDSRNLIWRVQAAQADAIKKWPRLLLEEVEKAVELNPNRRLQPTPGAPTRSDMSVVDAIEQGLIKVDYDDELSDDNTTQGG
ncbi:MAG: hypothetical protein R3C44_07310 [Chloroflexota bacterium]